MSLTDSLPVDIQAVIFDFDGTLATLTIDFNAMKRELLALVQKAVPDAELDLNLPALEWLEGVAQRWASSAHEAADLVSQGLGLIQDLEVEAAHKGNLFDFTLPLLDYLASLGLKRGIITRNCTEAVEAVFPDVQSVVDVVLTRDDVTRVKPDPEHLGRAMTLLGGSAPSCLMVGDHPLDMQAGVRAGCLPVGVLTGHSTQEELLTNGACFVGNDARDVVGFLRQGCRCDTEKHEIGGRF